MKLGIFLGVILASLLFLIPKMSNNGRGEFQAQEESIEDRFSSNIYRVIYKAKDPSENSIADIIWMKKAAELAQNAGIPYFNVITQDIHSEYSEEYGQDLSVVDGQIELKNDSMQAEYDAVEIETLVLPDSNF